MTKVYISSTTVDLHAERKLVIDSLIKAGHHPIHSYRPVSDPLVEACLRDVRGSDVYLLLLGRRYGDRPRNNNPENLSITHLEFREALACNKPLVVLEQSNPPMELSDEDQKRADDLHSRQIFWDEVKNHATPDRWKDDADLTEMLLIGVHEAIDKIRSKAYEGAPAITPGASPPHARLLSHSLLLIHLAGPDDRLAARLAATLSEPGIAWSVQPWRCDVEDGIDWRTLDHALARCRSAAVLLTDSASRWGRDAAALCQVVEFAHSQTGFVAGFMVGSAAASMPWLQRVGFAQRHTLDEWAECKTDATTTDLSEAVHAMSGKHHDITDKHLVGLQCLVVVMTRAEAQELRDQPQLREGLNVEQERFLNDSLTCLQQAGIDWVARYGDVREDWQPFGPRGGMPLSVMSVLRDVVRDIHGQGVNKSRRDQDALNGHRIRLRPYSFEPVMLADQRVGQLIEQVLSRRLLVLVDELSLCHPKVRAAAVGTLIDPHLAVVTVSPFNPPQQTLEAALCDNSVLQLGNLRQRFRMAMDPNCEVHLGCVTRLMRWLRVSIPETIRGQGGAALSENRAHLRRELGL